MPARFSLAILASATALAITMPASAAPSPKGNIVARAMTSPDHETLVAAVKAADLVGTLASGGPFTLFAPTDAAFEALPAGTLDTLLQPANKAQLQAILTYHVVAGEFTAADIIALIERGGGSATLTTVEGGTLTASLSGGSVIVTDENGGTATVIAADLKQSNGIIHVTDAVSLPQ